jgi:hypothetical protein
VLRTNCFSEISFYGKFVDRQSFGTDATRGVASLDRIEIPEEPVCFSRSSLAPVSFVIHPSAPASAVTGSNPNYAGTWRTNPLSSYPHISVAIPALVSSNPHVSWSGCDSNHPNSDRRRRRDANHRRLCNSNHPSQQQDSQERHPGVGHSLISFSHRG